LDPMYANENDPVSGYAGIPTEMTGMGTIMQRAGYATHFVGKWDVGMATPHHTPRGRGYNISLSYFHHTTDYWDQRFYGTSAAVGNATSVCRGFGGFSEWRPVDLWQDNGTGADAPARGRNNSLTECVIATPEYCFPEDHSVQGAARECPAHPGNWARFAEQGPRRLGPDNDQAGTECLYEDGLFQAEVLRTISEHDVSQPLFLFWALHIVHAPLQVPKKFLDMYSDVATDDWRRQRYLAMTRYMDSAVERVTAVLKTKGMYNDTLIVFNSDNGGPIYRNVSVGANNWPLKGGKGSNWDGGIRVNAFVSGGFVPQGVRGTRLGGLGTLWDWYGTFASLGGVDAFDSRASAAGLPPVDSVNLWPYIAGDVKSSPRVSIALGSSSCIHQYDGCINEWGDAPSVTIVNGIISDDRASGGGLWKLLIGPIPMDGWQGPHYPNASTLAWAAEASIRNCGGGCLFNLDVDPTEHQNLAIEQPERVQSMLATIRRHNSTAFSPDRGKPDYEGACRAAMERYRGFWGPWRGITARAPSDQGHANEHQQGKGLVV